MILVGEDWHEMIPKESGLFIFITCRDILSFGYEKTPLDGGADLRESLLVANLGCFPRLACAGWPFGLSAPKRCHIL
jgi:hypothetical protein